MSDLKKIKEKLVEASDPKKALVSARFFKTGKGEYGEGDVFLGITVPVQRKIARSFPNLSFKDIFSLLKSPIHEHRFTALENLVFQYEKGDGKKKKEIFDFYMVHTDLINNWDLVDTSAPYIVGNFIFDKERSVLYKLVQSRNMWERRIAIVATWYLINKNDLKDVFALSKILLGDIHDLIHKAVGWMLREAGKKNVEELKNFIKAHYTKIPRTTLRYAIERFSQDERRKYLKGLV